MKKLFLPILLLLSGHVLAQQQEELGELRMSPRANVVTYDNENAIEHLSYTGSSLAPSGYGLWLGEKLVGLSHDCYAVTEFDITSLVRFGKSMPLTVRYAGNDDGSLLDPFQAKESANQMPQCILMLKPLLNVQDYTVSADYNPADQSGSYSVEADIFNAKAKGKSYLEVEIWDYKGTHRFEQGDPRMQQYVYQMQVYAELYRKQTGIMPQKAIIYFLNTLGGDYEPRERPGNAVFEVTLDPESVDIAMDDFSDTVAKIEESRRTGIWSPPGTTPPKETCDICDKRWTCTYSQEPHSMRYP